METSVRIGNIELLRSFFVCLLGAMCLFNAYTPLTPYVCSWRSVAADGMLYLPVALAGFLAMRHYRGVGDFKNRPYALLLIGAGILCALTAFVIAVIASRFAC